MDLTGAGETVARPISPRIGKIDMGIRFTTPSGAMGEHPEGVRYEDINGDGRDDLIYVDAGGATWMWSNSRSCRLGVLGDGLNIAWREAYHTGATTGPNTCRCCRRHGL